MIADHKDDFLQQSGHRPQVSCPHSDQAYLRESSESVAALCRLEGLLPLIRRS